MNLEIMKQKYLEYVRINKSEGTYRCYSCHLNYILTYFKKNDKLEDGDLNTNTLTEYIIFEHENGVKNSTINKRIKPLKLMFRYNGILNEEVLNLKKLKEDKTTFNALTNGELIKVVNYLNSNALKLQNKLLIYLLIDTGIRVNELLNIKRININFLNRTIFLDVTKTHISRIVPFTDATAELLKEYIKKVTFEDDKLFALTISGVESLFRRIKYKLGFNTFHPHMLRHSLATKLHKNGISVMIIKRIMGHSNVTTTERYIHFDLEDILVSYNKVMN